MLRAAILVALACCALAAHVSPIHKPLNGLTVSFSKRLQNDELCKICINEAVVIINELLNEGLRDVELGCKGLCSHVSSKDLQETCTITCDALGIVEYIKLLSRTEIDPIYYCEVIHGCARGDCSGDCADLVSQGVNPPSGDTKTVFHAGFILEVKQNITATGMLRIEYRDQNDPKDPGETSDELTQEIPIGNYSIALELDARQLGLGPSSKKEGDTADYILTVSLCEGECGSSKPWSRILASASSEFNVTKVKQLTP